MNTFRRSLQGAGFTITADLSAQHETSIDEALGQAEMLAASVDGIQLAESGSQASAVAMAGLLVRKGIDPIPRLSCRDRNRIALQSDLLGLRAMGVTSLILEQGSQMPIGIDTPAKTVFNLDCRELIATAGAMNDEEWADGSHEFIIGAAAEVSTTEPEWNADTLLAHADAGARFLQTQPCFDMDLLRRYMRRLVESRVTWSYSVIATLAPLPCAKTARWLAGNGSGSLVPDNLIERLEAAPDPGLEGIGICAGLMQELAAIPGISGVNLLVLGNPLAVQAAIAESGLRT